jgi:hypothetical protein
MAHFSCRRPQVVAGDNLGALTGQLGCRESAKGVDAGQISPMAVQRAQKKALAALRQQLVGAG